MIVKSYAKVNLGLKILGKSENGMHLINSVAMPVSLFDDVIVNLNNSNKIKISSDQKDVPINQDNICYRAIKALQEKHPFQKGVDVKIIKRIPMMAGLGGGSSNAAAVLVALNELLDLKLTKKELADIGIKVGSDVPFFIYNKLAVIAEDGSKIIPIKTPLKLNLILVKPSGVVSTKEAYDAFDKSPIKSLQYRVREHLENANYAALIKDCFNDLEAGAKILCPEINEVERVLEKEGFDYVGMSGSGSCVYALSQDKDLLKACEEKLKNKYPFVKIVHQIN